MTIFQFKGLPRLKWQFGAQDIGYWFGPGQFFMLLNRKRLGKNFFSGLF